MCITLLCSLPHSWDSLVVAIGNTTQSTLKFEDVIVSLLLEEMRRNFMEGMSQDDLSLRGRPQEWENNSFGVDPNIEVYLNLEKNI
jgi:hypothetical protein